MVKYDWKKTLKKFGVTLALAVIATILGITLNFLNVTNFPPEAMVYVSIGTSILKALQNYLKHRNK